MNWISRWMQHFHQRCARLHTLCAQGWERLRSQGMGTMRRDELCALLCGASVAGMIGAALLGWWQLLGLSAFGSLGFGYLALSDLPEAGDE